MAAIKKEELARLEKEYGLEPEDLSYQHRCSRITAYMNGEGDSWSKPETQERSTSGPTISRVEQHPLYGKRILITPMMTPDAKRNLAYEEVLGPYMEVEEVNAGEAIYGAGEDIDRMVGDYKVIRRDNTKRVTAKTTFPKIGTEISWMMGKEICPVVRGNKGDRGYVWSLPTSVIKVPINDDEYAYVQIYGLKTLIQQVYPELLPKFSGKPVMSYIDGITLAASIPQTEAILKEHRRKEMMDAKVGLI